MSNRQIPENKNPFSEKNGNPKQPGKYTGFSFWILIAILFGLWMYYSFTKSTNGATDIDYTTFRKEVTTNSVSKITIKGSHIYGNLKHKSKTVNAKGDTVSYSRFSTFIPSFGGDKLMTLLDSHHVTIRAEPNTSNNWWPIILAVLPIIFIIGIGYMFYKQMHSQGHNILSIGKSQAHLYHESEEDVTFDDVAGNEGPKTELREIISFLKNPDRFKKLGGNVPTGVLLVGPPGTGKTLLARAVAGEANVPFFYTSGSDFMEMFVGIGAKRVRNLFQDAKKNQPSIIFVDELDSIGRQRGAGLGGGHDEREQTLNQLLSELDGFEQNENVIVMGATNRPDILDKALLRPGRFDRQINVDLPTRKNRLAIMKIHARGKPIAKDVDLDRIARGTPGFSGADLQNLLNESALIAARNKKNEIEAEDIESARDKIMMGLERKSIVLTEDEKKLIAYHESGHALVAASSPIADPIHKVTIVPRGRAMGVTQQIPEDDRYLYRREYMLDRLAIMMGGRAAEGLIFDTATSGAENDLQQATRLARKMVINWGMSKKFEHMAMGSERQNVFLGEELGHRREYSEATAREIDEEIKFILSEAYNKALGTLEENRDILDQVAGLLLEREEIPGEKVSELFNKSREKAPDKESIAES